MKNQKHVWIFGYNKQSRSIAASLLSENFSVTIIENDNKNFQDALSGGYLNSILIDITEDTELEKLDIKQNDWILCMMEDEYLNVFLTLSLSASCTCNQIIAISHSIYSTQKLKMAGANQVIDVYQVSANRIHNIFEKPIATKLLDNFISATHEISFQEFVISKNSSLNGIIIDDVDFGKFDIIFTGMVDKELGDEFIFAASNINHKLDDGDIIICIGKNEDLAKFSKYLYKDIT
ncbi:MAG: TrkA family potassium uptake protein [Campylobacterales bacterium]|nr:TrkA family potassium uptake protein [Campylobacterales bacterium]